MRKKLDQKGYSLLTDETQDSFYNTSDQICVCIRYLKDGKIREDFLGFVKTSRMNAKTISENLISSLQKWGLNMDNLVGQGYDGAAVMSSKKHGVQGIIQRQYTNAVFVHCRSHVMALAISSGCSGCKSVPQMRNLFDQVEKITWFLSGSAKRKEIFREVDKAYVQRTVRRATA